MTPHEMLAMHLNLAHVTEDQILLHANIHAGLQKLSQTQSHDNFECAKAWFGIA